MPDAVAVLKCIASAVLFEPPFNTSILNDSVALVPILNVTSALFASSNISISPLNVNPVSVPKDVIPDCAASTLITELEAVSPVPANNVARSAIASFLVALLSLASENINESPFAIAPAEKLCTLPITASPFSLKVLPEAKLIPESSISKMSVPSTLNTYLPLSPLLEAAAV